MIQMQIAFLDEEEAYVKQLQGYLVEKKERFFKIDAFTTAEAFLEAAERGASYDATVLTEAFQTSVPAGALLGKKILLCESGTKAADAKWLSVAKHQSAGALLRQISAMLWQESKGAAESALPTAAELIGIYSPVRHEGQLLFGVTMARVLGEEKKTLYVNLTSHSGFFGLTNTSHAEDIGDLLYGMMQEGHDFATGLHRVCGTYRNFDYIAPALNPEHLSELSGSLFSKLVLELKGRSGYQAVILDFGMIFSGFAETLPAFSAFYCLGKEGLLNRYRTEEFLDYVNKAGDCAAARMSRLTLPEELFLSKEADLPDGCLYGSMGDYVRNCLYGGIADGR